jgi:hypothetical protein
MAIGCACEIEGFGTEYVRKLRVRGAARSEECKAGWWLSFWIESRFVVDWKVENNINITIVQLKYFAEAGRKVE